MESVTESLIESSQWLLSLCCSSTWLSYLMDLLSLGLVGEEERILTMKKRHDWALHPSSRGCKPNALPLTFDLYRYALISWQFHNSMGGSRFECTRCLSAISQHVTQAGNGEAVSTESDLPSLLSTWVSLVVMVTFHFLTIEIICHWF